MDQDDAKSCFIIAPIGEKGSETRTRSDQVLTHIIKPVVEKYGYVAIRADDVSEPGVITAQIIQHLIDDDLVIADLTGKNPNVFYELAVRHTLKKPVLLIIQAGEVIPFDVAQQRNISFDYKDLDSVATCKTQLAKNIENIESCNNDFDSPISMAIELQYLRQSDDPIEKGYGEIISMLQDIRSSISKISNISSGRNDLRSQNFYKGFYFGPVGNSLKEMEWDRFITNLSSVDRANLVKMLNDIPSYTTLGNSYMPSSASRGYGAATLNNPYTTLHTYPGFRISEELFGGYKIEFYASEIIVGNEDILVFRDYVATRAG
jgi:hypothetical protein